MSINPLSAASQLINCGNAAVQIDSALESGTMSPAIAANQFRSLEGQYASFPNIVSDLNAMAADLSGPNPNMNAYHSALQTCYVDLMTSVRQDVNAGLGVIQQDGTTYQQDPTAANAGVLAGDAVNLNNFFAYQLQQPGGAEALASVLGMPQEDLFQIYNPTTTPPSGIAPQIFQNAAQITADPVYPDGTPNPLITTVLSNISTIMGMLPSSTE